MKDLFIKLWNKLMDAIYALFFKVSSGFIKRYGCYRYDQHSFYPFEKIRVNKVRHSGNRKTYYIHKKCIFCGKTVNSQQYSGSERCRRTEIFAGGVN